MFFGTSNGVNYPTLHEASNSPVGVVPFKFVRSHAVPGNAGGAVTGVTAQLIRAMATGGGTLLSLFTGNPNDEGTALIFTGRDPDSGTRLSALAETGFGIGAKTVVQYQPQDSGGVAVSSTASTITQLALWPAETIDTLPVATGNGGYASGGDLAKAMGAADTITTFSNASGDFTFGGFITYVGTNDIDPILYVSGTGAATGLATELTYNGVKLGPPQVSGSTASYNNNNNILEGQYTFWSFEHLYYRNGSVNTLVGTVANTVAKQIHDNTAILKIGNLQVTRPGDGQVVTSENF